MSFTNSYRLERIYFEKLKDMINKLQPYLNEETDEKLKAILENSIDDNGAILLLYRNLGEAWTELSDLIKKADEKIEQTKEEAEKYHDELNERIDEVNSYLINALNVLDERKIEAPLNPETGAFLVWNGTAWVAQTLATWQGGSY